MLMSAGNEDYLNKPRAYKSVKSVRQRRDLARLDSPQRGRAKGGRNLWQSILWFFAAILKFSVTSVSSVAKNLCGLLKQFGDCLGEVFGGGDSNNSLGIYFYPVRLSF